jgi:hypothetical protein
MVGLPASPPKLKVAYWEGHGYTSPQAKKLAKSQRLQVMHYRCHPTRTVPPLWVKASKLGKNLACHLPISVANTVIETVNNNSFVKEGFLCV